MIWRISQGCLSTADRSSKDFSVRMSSTGGVPSCSAIQHGRPYIIDEYRWFKPLVPKLRSRNHYAAAFGGGVVGQLWLIADLKQQSVFMASWFLGVGPPSFWFLCSKMPNTLCLLDCTELCWRCGSAYHWLSLGTDGDRDMFLVPSSNVVLVEQKIANIRPK